jgi:hypothetical protein
MKKSLALFGIVFLFFSCISSDTYVSSGNDGTKQNSSHSPSADTAKNLKTPSMSEQASSGHWITGSTENAITIIGVSGLQVKSDDEISAAKEDAARKAAMYHGVRGNIESFHSSGANFFDYVADSKIELDYDTDYAKYIDSLIFDPKNDVVKTDNAVFVRFKYAASAIPVDFTASMNNEGRPNWTYSRDLPRIEGFLTAVGFARNQVRLRDTIRKSTEAAAARMIEGISTQVISTDRAATGMGASGQIQTRSAGKLNNFQTIEFWIDPKTGYVYTLAIARQGN